MTLSVEEHARRAERRLRGEVTHPGRRHIHCKATMAALYDAGCADAEIARQMGCDHTTVIHWRRKTGRAANFEKGNLGNENGGGRPEVFCKTRMQALYDNGLNDNEIARQMGCSAALVAKWRLKIGRKAQSCS